MVVQDKINIQGHSINQKSNSTMSFMIFTSTTFVKKNSCLVARITLFDTVRLHLLTFGILEPYTSKDTVKSRLLSPPVISPSNLKQIFHPGYKPPGYKPIYFYYFFFHSFHYEVGFFQFRQKQEKVKKTKVRNIFTFLITLMLF